ncbi:MAG: outer membrane beta-barrel domain-containing protein [Pseudobdellovibrionaceae bacterium]
MRKSFLLSTALFVLIHFVAPTSWAQEEEGLDNSSDVDQIEAELTKRTAKTPVQQEPQIEKDEKLENFSGLGKLAPFSEISVIQKRFMPKTGRFQFFGGLTNVVNDPWFTGLGLDARFGYHFTESWSVEATGVFLSNSQREAIKDLYEQHGVRTDSIITAKGYTGGAVVWNPIYGKMGLFNRRIIPFDMYFSLGGGSTTVDGGTGGSTLHFGTGQIFALSKAMGFRWDFSWNTFNATPSTAGAASQSFNNLLLTFGLSFFFPEAKYR